MEKQCYPNYHPSPNTENVARRLKNFLCLVLLSISLAGATSAVAQTQVIVGTGTATSSTASIFSTSTTTNKYSKNIAIYSAADILAAGGMAGNITKIAWYKDGTGEYAANDIELTVSIKPVTFTTHATSPITYATEITGATQVFTSTTQNFITGNGWNEITLQTPFNWDGSSNLEVFVEFYRPGTPTGSINWRYTTTTDANASQVSGSAPTTASRNSNRPNIRLEIIPGTACTAPPTPGTATTTAATVCANTNFTLNLNGSSLGSGQTYQWETSANGTSGWAPVGTAMPSALLTTTQTAGTHYYRAAVTCSGQTAYSTVVSVTSPAPASGTYTIDKNAAATATNFQSFTAAIASLNCGIGGPVVFNVVANSGPYIEQVEIMPFNGASATNTITFNGNNETITADPGTGSRAVIRLNGADYVTINNLNIEATGTATSSFGWGVHFMNGANNNTISNCDISIGSTSTTESNSAGIVFSNSLTSVTSNGDNGSNNIISGNTITGGYKGIHLNANASATTPNAGNNQIINNTITNFYSTGIELDQAIGTLIKNNNLSRPTRSSSPTSVYMIYLGDNTHSTVVDGNRIHNTHGGNTTATGGAYGIYATASDAASGSENIVKNNLIYNVNNAGTINALYNSSSDGIYYYHNSINLDNTAHTAFARGFYQTTSASNIKLINNNISITTGGVAGNLQALYYNSLVSVIESNYNNLYVPTGNVGYYDGASHQTLANWQAANTTAPFDANSLAVNPNFTNAGTGNLIPTNMALNNAGTFIAAAATDINGVARTAPNTDMGAYEFPVTIGIRNDQAAGINFSIYPNPTKGIFEVKINGLSKEATIGLYTITGKLISSETIKGNQKETIRKMDASRLPAGVYLIKIASENTVNVSRLVVN